MPVYRSPDILSGSEVDEVADIDGIVWTIPDGIQSADNAAKTFTVTANFKRNGADVAIKLPANAFGIHGISSATATHSALTTAASSVVITVSIPANRHGSIYLQLNNGASSDPDDYPLGTQFSPTIGVDTRAVPEDADIDGILWQIPDGTQIADGAIKTFDVTANFKRNGADQAIKLAADAFSVHGISSATATSPALAVAATSVVITVSIPADRHGSVYLQLNAGASSEPDDYPLETQFSPTMPVDTREVIVSGIRPDVGIETPDFVRISSFLATFKWTQGISGLTASDITLSAGTLSNLSGEGDTWTAEVTPPANANGTLTITVAADAVANEDGLTGPEADKVVSVGYDTRTQSFTNPVGSCVKTYNFDATANEFVPGAGAFEGWLEILGVRHGNVDYLYGVLQLSEWTTEYDGPPNAAVLLGHHLDLDSQARACLVKVNISTCVWSILKQYRFVSTAARSLHLKNNEVYWFEGSHYCYYNEGLFRRIEAPDGKFYIHWVGDPTDTDDPNEKGRWTRKAPASNDGEYSISGSQITFVTSRTSASYNDVRETLGNNARMFIGDALIRIGTITLTNVNVNVARYVASFTLISGTLPAVDDKDEIHLLAGNSVEVFSKYRFRPLAVAADVSGDDWKAEVGHLYKVHAGGTVTDLGLNWVSSDLSEEPRPDATPDFEKERIDRFYGAHGGTASPMVEDADGNLHLITGYGDLDDVTENTSEAARLGNWQQIVFADNLNQSVPVLETNERTSWDILKDAAIMTDGVIAFDKDTFVFQPRTPLKAKLSQSIPAQNYPSSFIFLKEPSRSTLPSSGDILIGSEIFSYTGVSGGNLTPFTREQEATIAELHAVDADVFWIDHILYWDKYAVDPMDRISVENDTVRIYNEIAIDYGAGKTYEVRDESSIDTYGLRRLDLRLPLDETQRAVVKYLAEKYLAELKQPRQVLRLTLKLSLFLQMLDVVYIRESDRTHLGHVFQVTSFDHRIFENETTVTGVLLKSIE